MGLTDEVKQSLMTLILENDLEQHFNELFNKYKKSSKDKDEKKFKIKNHLITEDKVLLNEEFFAYILLDNKDIKSSVYNDLIKLIYSNLTISRLTIRLDDTKYNNVFSFLTLSLMNRNLKLNKSQKEFVIKEALSKDTGSHVNNGYDIRYFILKSSNWTLEEKLELIPKLYDPITIEAKMLELKHNIHRMTVEKYDIEKLFNLPFEDYYCLVKLNINAEMTWEFVQEYYIFYIYKQRQGAKTISNSKRVFKKEDNE